MVTRLTPLLDTTEGTDKQVKYITEVVFKKMDPRKLRAMVNKRQERNEVSRTITLASSQGSVPRLQRRKGESRLSPQVSLS